VQLVTVSPLDLRLLPTTNAACCAYRFFFGGVCHDERERDDGLFICVRLQCNVHVLFSQTRARTPFSLILLFSNQILPRYMRSSSFTSAVSLAAAEADAERPSTGRMNSVFVVNR
jgi:hypothetical protein